MPSPMDRVQQLLSGVCEDIEGQVKSRLHGGIAELVRDYLPQVWVFETECGACTLLVDTEGYARVHPGSDRSRDVTIIWRRESLESVLASRSRDKLKAGDYPDVLVNTEKGRAAFNYLKREIGL